MKCRRGRNRPEQAWESRVREHVTTLHFIVVEKDDDLRSIYRMKLEQKFPGCGVIETPSCSEALDAMGEMSIDAVIVDQTALDCSGLQALRNIRHVDARIPLVAIGQARMEEVARRNGATAFIDESRWSELGNTVEAVLEPRSKRKRPTVDLLDGSEW